MKNLFLASLLLLAAGTTAQSVQQPFGGKPQVIPGVVLAENYDEGGQDVAFFDTDAANVPGGYRPDEAVDLQDNRRGGFHVGYIDVGEWVEYTVVVEQTGIYTVTADVATEVESGAAFELIFPGEQFAYLPSIPPTTNWYAHRVMDLRGRLFLRAGEQIFRFNVTGNRPFNLDLLTFTLESTSTEEAASAAGFTVAPNPVRDEALFTVPMGSDHGDNRVIELLDARGVVVRKVAVTGPTLRLEMRDLPAGVYLARLAGRRPLVRRLIKL